MDSIRRCSVEDCERPHFGKGYCNTHYNRIRRNGTLELKQLEAIEATRRERRITEDCYIEGCDRRASRRFASIRVCGLHGKRFDRNGGFEATRKWGAPNPDKRQCVVTGCTELQDGNSEWCKMHGTRVRRNGDPNFFIPQSERNLPRGEKHHGWNHSGSYVAVHQRLKKVRGSADQYRCIKCDKNAAQWAYQHGDAAEQFDFLDGCKVPFSVNLEAYAPMCVQCHKRMDLEHINGKEKASGVLA